MPDPTPIERHQATHRSRRSDLDGAAGSGPIQRSDSGRRLDEDERLQAEAQPGATPTVSAEMASGIQSLRGRGRSLPGRSQSFFEPRFGFDLREVKIHDDAAAARGGGADLLPSSDLCPQGAWPDHGERADARAVGFTHHPVRRRGAAYRLASAGAARAGRFAGPRALRLPGPRGRGRRESRRAAPATSARAGPGRSRMGRPCHERAGWPGRPWGPGAAAVRWPWAP